MKVLYDYAAFAMQVRGGVSRALFELFRHVAGKPDIACRLFAGFHQNEYLRRAEASLRPHIVGCYLPGRIARQRVLMPINRRLFQLYARRFDPDLCHYTYFDTPDLPPGCKTVITMHDLIHERFPEMYGPDSPQPLWKARAVERADGIVCVSENTRRDLAKYLDVEQKAVSVIHHGNSMPGFEPDRVEEPGDYLLFVGTRRVKYKNFRFVLEAFAHVRTKTHWSLLCFGGGDFAPEERDAIKRLGLEGRVRQVSGSDAQLAGCYHRAVALVFPSTYEGFGLPPIEAMGCGCPVLASNAPPMPEVIGDAGLYFDPEDHDALCECMMAMQKAEARDRLRRAGSERARRFTWDSAADQAVTFYRSLW